MVFNQLLRRFPPLTRNIATSAVRNSGHDTRGIPGSVIFMPIPAPDSLCTTPLILISTTLNLPFPVDNRYKLLALFMIYFGSGIALPFLTLRHLIIKRSS